MELFSAIFFLILLLDFVVIWRIAGARAPSGAAAKRMLARPSAAGRRQALLGGLLPAVPAGGRPACRAGLPASKRCKGLPQLALLGYHSKDAFSTTKKISRNG